MKIKSKATAAALLGLIPFLAKRAQGAVAWIEAFFKDARRAAGYFSALVPGSAAATTFLVASGSHVPRDFFYKSIIANTAATHGSRVAGGINAIQACAKAKS